MGLFNKLHIFEPMKVHTFEPNISLISLISLMFNYAKPRLLAYICLNYYFPHYCYHYREALSVMVLCNNNKKRIKYSLVLY